LNPISPPELTFDQSRLPAIVPDELAGKVAIVTGGGSGMGRAAARRLAAAGAAVVVNDLSVDSAVATATGILGAGGRSIAIGGNVTDAVEISALVAGAESKFGGVHILVNAAGVLRRTSVYDMQEDEWDFVIGVNLKGTFLPSRAVLRPMHEAGWGRIVNFSSTAGKTTSTLGSAAYTASKHAVLGFTRHLAMEEASHGITVNAVCPGLIDTEMVQAEVDQDLKHAYTSSFPISRLGDPSEVAELVAFLASDRAAYITGQALDISGGDLMV
jgi:NAD(P)-dependent dehydrogenase (short-subunit alcohol dehydrogenase family)